MVYLLKCTTGPCLCKLFQTFVKSCFPAIFCASYIGVEKYLKIDNTTRLKILYLKVWRLKLGSWFSSSCINSRKFYHLHFWNHTSFLLSSVKALQSCRGSIKNVKWKMKDGRLKLYIELGCNKINKIKFIYSTWIQWLNIKGFCITCAYLGNSKTN